MNDDDLRIDAALDDELDAAASLALQRELARDPALQARWEARRELRAALRGRATYHETPAALRRELEAMLGIQARADESGEAGEPDDREAERLDAMSGPALAHERADPQRRARLTRDARSAVRRGFARFVNLDLLRPWAYAAGGALAACLLTLLVVDPAALHLPGSTASSSLARQDASTDADTASEAVSAHTRALLVDHPIEVASSDQHTVRPWLSARLNFVPPVVDFASQGYVLLGARRDVLAGETAAALVYRHGAHVVSVFVQPARGRQAAAGPAESVPAVIRGFNVVQRTRGGMAFCLVSDLNPRELEALAELLTGPQAR